MRFVAIAALVGLVVGNPNQFTAIHPGGQTKCVKGGDYAFLYRKGTINKLVVDFQGGGACWDELSCLMPIYSTNVNAPELVRQLNGPNSGVQSQHPNNPLNEWHYLFVPYCSGDCHLGNNPNTSYGLHHVGRVNVDSALDYIYKTVPAPEEVATIGCSAGSLGSFGNAPYIMKHYGNAIHHQWGDSYVGVVAKNQWTLAVKNWNLKLAQFIPGYDPKYIDEWDVDTGAYIVYTAANYFPNSTYSVYTSNADSVQQSFFSLGGGQGSWTAAMREEIRAAQSNATHRNVGAFIASGARHCTSTDNSFWSVKSGGVLLADWLTKELNGDPSWPKFVDCTPNCN